MSQQSRLEDRLAQRGLPALPEPLPRPITDSHTHADTTTDYAQLSVADSLALARRVGVTRLVQVGCDPVGNRYAVDLARQTPGVVACVSIHPNEAARAGDALDEQLAQVAALATAGDFVRGIGETGLDYFRTRDPEGHERQKYSFARHIELAIEHDLTLVIHDRDAHADVLTVLDARTGMPLNMKPPQAAAATPGAQLPVASQVRGEVSVASATRVQDERAENPDVARSFGRGTSVIDDLTVRVAQLRRDAGARGITEGNTPHALAIRAQRPQLLRVSVPVAPPVTQPPGPQI